MTAGSERAGDGTQLTALPSNEGVDAAVSAARRVIAALLHAGNTSAAEMNEVAGRLGDVADYLDEHAPDVEQRMIDMWAGEGYTRHDPVTGPENAVAPPLHLRGLDDGSVVGTTVLGMAYQGPPGYVHGGVSAMILDHTLGVVNGWAGASGVTAELTLRYLRLTPLFEPLEVTARQVGVDGRKIRTEGSISAGGEICVEARGLFVARHVPRPR